MNMSSLIFKIKKELGLGTFLKTTMSDEAIARDIIQAITLPVFSRYFKNNIIMYNTEIERVNDSGLHLMKLSPSVRQSMEHCGVIFKGIKDIKPTRQGVKDDTESGVVGSMAYYGPISYGGGSFGLDAMASSLTAVSEYESQDRGMVHQFIEPNHIQFAEAGLNYSRVKYDISIFTNHSKNLSTIQDGLGNSFEQLAKLDVMRILWDNELKYINGVETTYIKVNLQIDDWANANAKREELLSKFDSMQLIYNTMVVTG